MLAEMTRQELMEWQAFYRLEAREQNQGPSEEPATPEAPETPELIEMRKNAANDQLAAFLEERQKAYTSPVKRRHRPQDTVKK